MKTETFIANKVNKYYWNDELNCATTTLKILSELYEIKLDKQVIDAALGMHGAGEHGAQCGLVEGTLMFLGIFGRKRSISDNITIKHCREFADQFETQFKSLLCNKLRPEGFHPDNPPNLCEPLTCRALKLSIDYLSIIDKRF